MRVNVVSYRRKILYVFSFFLYNNKIKEVEVEEGELNRSLKTSRICLQPLTFF